MTARTGARALLAVAGLGLSLTDPAPGRAQDGCSVDAGGFRAVIPPSDPGSLRLHAAPGGGRVQIAGPGGICFLALRRPETTPAPLALRQDDLTRGLLSQVRRAEIHGIDIDYVMPEAATSRGGLPLRLGWTQLRDEGRRYAAETVLDPDTGAHVTGICALQDLDEAPLAEAFLRSVHLAPSPDLPGDCAE